MPAWPSTRFFGNPVASWASAVISSSGLETTMTTAFGRVLGDVLGDAADDLGVDLEQVHPAHARLARQAGGDHDDVGALDLLVARAVGAGGDADDLGLEALDRPGLVEVEREALGLALDDVGEHDRVEDVVLGQALRGRRAVEAGADDGDLLAHGRLNSLLPADFPRPYQRRSGLPVLGAPAVHRVTPAGPEVRVADPAAVGEPVPQVRGEAVPPGVRVPRLEHAMSTVAPSAVVPTTA